MKLSFKRVILLSVSSVSIHFISCDLALGSEWPGERNWLNRDHVQLGVLQENSALQQLEKLFTEIKKIYVSDFDTLATIEKLEELQAAVKKEPTPYHLEDPEQMGLIKAFLNYFITDLISFLNRPTEVKLKENINTVLTSGEPTAKIANQYLRNR